MIVEIDQYQAGVVFDDFLTTSNAPADLTGFAAAAFVMSNEDDPTGATRTTNADVIAVFPAHVAYTATPADFATLGTFRQQWLITYGDGTSELYPDDPNVIVVTPVASATVGPRLEPDPWITWDDVLEVGDPPDLNVIQQDLALLSASDLMWQLSGRQFGLWTATARPIPFCGHTAGTAPRWWGAGLWASPPAQSWRPCSCSNYAYLHLGDAPIARVIDVTIDGTTLPSSAYRVDEHNYLARLDGNPWPICNDLAANSGVGVFEVTWTYGVQVPTAGRLACALLALRFAIEIAEDTACAIPGDASSVATEGVTIKLDTSAMSEKGRTGLLLPDMWLDAVAPNGPNGMAGGFDPGRRREFWTVGTA